MKKLRLEEMKAPAHQSPGAKWRGQRVTAASSVHRVHVLRRAAKLSQLSVSWCHAAREGRGHRVGSNTKVPFRNLLLKNAKLSLFKEKDKEKDTGLDTARIWEVE